MTEAASISGPSLPMLQTSLRKRELISESLSLTLQSDVPLELAHQGLPHERSRAEGEISSVLRFDSSSPAGTGSS